MNQLIAVVDDEQDIAELVAVNLKKHGYRVKEYSTAASFFRGVKNTRPDLVVLDLMLPDMDGFEICKKLKADGGLSSIPVIMLTAKTDETDKVLGLELGADDYVTKPFSPRELAARVKVILRRHEEKPGKHASQPGGITIDPQRFTVTADGKQITVTTTEFKILELLASRPGFVFSREKLLDHLWGDDKMVLDRTIDVHIKNLREKLGKAGDAIKNIRGVGYKLEE